MISLPRRFIIVAASAALIGCGTSEEPVRSRGGSGEPAPAAPTAAPTAQRPAPSEAPDIRGIVTAVENGAVQIEENPAEESGSPKAAVRLSSETVVLYRGGELATAADLTIGHNVSAWFDGPVAEPYPVQATAETIVIEPAGAP